MSIATDAPEPEGIWRKGRRRRRLRAVQALPSMLTLANGLCDFLIIHITIVGSHHAQSETSFQTGFLHQLLGFCQIVSRNFQEV